MTPTIEDWVAETPASIAARLDGAKSSQAQTRLTIGAMALVSVMMLIAVYNAYLSYDYGWIRREGDVHIGDERISEILTQQALKDWAASRTVQISLIGIRVSVDDAAVLGTLVLFVLSVWLLLLSRRENYTIVSLLGATDTKGDTRSEISSGGQRWLIFHTIAANSMFVAVDPSLDGEEQESKRRPFAESLSKSGFGFARDFFFMFPPIAAMIVFVLDRASYAMPDPFQRYFALPEKGMFYVSSMVIFFTCWLPLVVCCWRSSRYSKETETILHDYGEKLRADLKQQSAATTPR